MISHRKQGFVKDHHWQLIDVNPVRPLAKVVKDRIGQPLVHPGARVNNRCQEDHPEYTGHKHAAPVGTGRFPVHHQETGHRQP